MEIWTWIVAHYTDVFTIIGGLVTVATLVVKLTPSPKDDSIVAKIGEWVVRIADWASVVNPKKPVE